VAGHQVLQGGHGHAAQAGDAGQRCAAATLMCGSSPLAEAVTRSMGTGAVWPGSAARRARCGLHRLTRAGLLGPRLEPPELAALSGMGLVAEGGPRSAPGR
jgi:hypothetical protein